MPFEALVLDIEGTTSSISFVKDELFPYVYKNVEGYLKEKCGDDALLPLIELSNAEAQHDSDVKAIASDAAREEKVDSLTKNIRTWIDKDKKLTAMKQIQGQMWKDAYEQNLIKGHVYDDVLPILQKLHDSGIPIYIYSSGSVQAQKLLFGYSIAGDMTKVLSGYFDTNIGYKQESNSYKKIADSIGKEPARILFLTDVEKEAYAAVEAGLQSKLVLRDGNAPLTAQALKDFETISNFAQLL
uniref:Enolase-phosphatase E1 n=1 Tax=Steinernema glaseri TaxID=37863 RepID=A0A1I7Y9G2_9BILA